MYFYLSAGKDVTDEELDAMLESGQTDVFTQNVSMWQDERSVKYLMLETTALLLKRNTFTVAPRSRRVMYEMMTDVLCCL